MDMDHGKSALVIEAEALIIEALMLLDEARIGLPAVHLQTALDLLSRQSSNRLPPKLGLEVFSNS